MARVGIALWSDRAYARGLGSLLEEAGLTTEEWLSDLTRDHTRSVSLLVAGVDELKTVPQRRRDDAVVAVVIDHDDVVGARGAVRAGGDVLISRQASTEVVVPHLVQLARCGELTWRKR